MPSFHSVLLAVACALSVTVLVAGQIAPNPPPIWPAQFIGTFGLYMFDVPSNSPIFNATSTFLYNIDIDSQMIQYPDRCVPVLPGGDQSPCNILFNSVGIYWNQPSIGVDCCTLIDGVGPTPRNFTNGFTWNGTTTAPDYHGNEHNCDYYVSPDGTFKYWTEIAVPPVTAHHDIFFRDGSGAFWAWETPLDVTPVDPSNFKLFADPQTCAQPCASQLGLSDEEHNAMQARARKSGMIQLALHHHQMKMKGEKEKHQQRHHHHQKRHGKKHL